MYLVEYPPIVNRSDGRNVTGWNDLVRLLIRRFWVRVPGGALETPW
jgi:hypothetical protein